MSDKHHPDCEFVTWAEVFKDDPNLPAGLDIDSVFAKEAGVMRCHAECPSLAEAVALGRELAAKHGW